ncbi:MAG: hypothetical protein KAU58_02675 [Candidatus Omnitrophica bacterium]|nr:hypothetical protein [Candidatus Omnitrophota bacterium]
MHKFLGFSSESIIELEEIAVPINECTKVTLGLPSQKIIEILERNNFDQALVKSDKAILGIVTTKRLKELLKFNKKLTSTDLGIKIKEIYTPCSFDNLLGFFSNDSFGLVVASLNGGEYGESEFVKGLITISDLNKHYFRSVIYIYLLQLEVLLADIISGFFQDSWEWIKQMNENRMVRILGYYELSKKRNVEINPIESCTLTDLLNIVSKNKSLLTRLGFHSRNIFEKHINHIPELRNSIMHPIKPLITKRDDIKWLRDTMNNIFKLGACLENLKQLATKVKSRK